MSPSESELRAALRAGEGDTVAADEIIAHARSARHERRKTLAAMGGAVAAVLAVGGTVAAVQLSHDDHRANPAGSAPATSTARVPQACPATPPNVNTPSASGGQLFPTDVTAIRVCFYDVQRVKASTVIDGPAARSYAQRFNALPPASKALACPLFLTQKAIVMLPVTASGPAATVVGKIGGCGTTSNGTAKRNAAELLTELETGLVVSSAPAPSSGTAKNSPGPGPS